MLFLSGVAPGPVHADVRPAIEFQIAGPARAARAGRVFSGTLVVSAHQSVSLDSLRLAGEGWRIVRFRAPRARMLSPGTPLRIAFRAIPSDPQRPLVILARVNGSQVEKWLDLSPEAAARAVRPGSVIAVPRRRPRRRRPSSSRRPAARCPSSPEVSRCAAMI